MRYWENVLSIIVGCLYLLYSIFFAALYIRDFAPETHVRLYTVIVISVLFSPKLGCVKKFVKYREIPLS
jgi:hypothetical protein